MKFYATVLSFICALALTCVALVASAAAATVGACLLVAPFAV